MAALFTTKDGLLKAVVVEFCCFFVSARSKLKGLYEVLLRVIQLQIKDHAEEYIHYFTRKKKGLRLICLWGCVRLHKIQKSDELFTNYLI